MFVGAIELIQGFTQGVPEDLLQRLEFCFELVEDANLLPTEVLLDELGFTTIQYDSITALELYSARV